ncbi:rhomboid family intramembrane serine protease [Patescibacteria group bacterium]|nr:rhomboid family intramembrane serine protease [Patescibacteria group bacterium]
MRGQQWYSLLTSMFLHGGRMHIIGNMVFLKTFGDNIEARMGNVKFLIFYLISGLVGSFAHILTDTASMIPSLGASGAISGVL